MSAASFDAPGTGRVLGPAAVTCAGEADFRRRTAKRHGLRAARPSSPDSDP